MSGHKKHFALSVSAIALLSVMAQPALADKCVTGIDTTSTDVVENIDVGTGTAITDVGLNKTTIDVVDSVSQTKNPPVQIDLPGPLPTITIIPGGLVVTNVSSTETPVLQDATLELTEGEFVNSVTPSFTPVIDSVTPQFGGASDTASTNSFACGQGASVDASTDSTAVGPFASAVASFRSSAFGAGAQANSSQHSTATGAFANASNSTGGTATGAGADASNSLNGTATGAFANVSNSTDSTATGAESDASNSTRSTATGALSDASDSENSTATGAYSDVSNSFGSTATGAGANASLSIGSTATGAGSSATLSIGSTANGALSDVSGTAFATANGFGSEVAAFTVGGTATGAFSFAGGHGASAYGVGSEATGNGSTAIGAGATASHANSSAIGAGSSTEFDGQMSFGNANNTYRMSGITSAESRATQSGPLEVVTTDANGHLASDGGQIFSKLGEHGAGIAIAIAMENPDLVGSETFGLAANVGFFDGNTAMAVSAMGVIGHDFFGGNERWAISGGVGVSLNENNFGGQDTDRTVAGRAGVQVSW